MAVRKRGDKWVADVPLFGRNGKRIRRTFLTRSLAITFERNLKVQEARGELDVIKQTPISLGKFIAKYFELHESGNRPSTGKRDVYVLRRLLDFVGDIHLTRISREMLERYKAHRQQAVKPATINLELRVTKSLFNRAREWGYLKRVPTEGLKMLRVDQKENFLLQLVPARKNPGDPLHSPLFG